MKRRVFWMAVLLAVVSCACLIPRSARAQTATVFTFLPDSVVVSFPTNAAGYYVLETSQDLVTFSPRAIAFGANGPQFTILATNAEAFFFTKTISVYAPEDSLGDGIDDVWKLENGYDPLDPALSERNSGMVDAGGNPLSVLQLYRLENRSGLRQGEGYSRDISVFNFGVPSARYEAFSRDLSLYNGEPILPFALPQEVYGREVSLFNFGRPAAGQEAFSREVAVYNGESPPLVVIPQEVYGREVGVFNSGQTLASVSTVSREVTAFNFGQHTAPLEAFSREVSVFNHTLN